MSDSLLLGRRWWWEEVEPGPGEQWFVLGNLGPIFTRSPRSPRKTQLSGVPAVHLKARDRGVALAASPLLQGNGVVSVLPWQRGIVPGVNDNGSVSPQK